jgi:hypothetical protein
MAQVRLTNARRDSLVSDLLLAYSDAKERNGGYSLSIYTEVSRLLDCIEYPEQMESFRMDLPLDVNRMMMTLRHING